MFTLPIGMMSRFDPMSLSPILWLDSSDGSTVTQSAGVVSQWDDKSGNDNNVSQSTSANRPLLVDNSINGRDIIRFDGVNDSLNSASLTGAISGVDVFYVQKSSDLAYIIMANSPRFALIAQDGSTSTGLNNTFGTPQYYKNGVLQSWANRDAVYEALKTDVTLVSIKNANISAWTGVELGAYAASGIFAAADIAELIVCPTLNNSDFNNTNNYLMDKWGVAA